MKNVGFSKKKQGIFSENLISEIVHSISDLPTVESVIDLDYRLAYVKNGKAYIGDTCLNDLDVFFWHDTVKPRDWGADNYIVNVLQAAEDDCAFINTPTSVAIVNDKFAAHGVLARNDVNVVDHALVDLENTDALEEIFTSFSKDIVLKPRFGGWGVGIVRARSMDELLSTVEYMQTFTQNSNEQIFIERFTPNDISKWVSIVAIGGKPVFGYRKKITNEDGWKVYDPQKMDTKGEYTDFVELDDTLMQLGTDAAQAIGKDIISFDCIYSTEDDTYYIVDENGRPGLYQHCIDKAGIDIKETIVNLVASKL